MLDTRPLAADVDTDRVGAYRGYDELVARWNELAAEAGGRLRVAGQSVRHAPLHCLELGPEEAPRVSAVIAGIHPIEWIGVETGLALLERLAADPPRDRRVLAFPLVNVDGYRGVERDLRRGRRRWRRSNAHGVDLNRNWPTHFKRTRRLFGGWNFGGPHPLSEPEIAAVVAELDEAVAAASQIDVALSLHSIGRMLLYPYGGRWRPPDAVDRLRAAARAVAARTGEPYTIRQSARWVPGAFAHGMEIDHLHDRYGAVALLVECSLGGAMLRDPASLISPFRWFNPPDPRRIAGDLAAALEPFVRGMDA